MKRAMMSLCQFTQLVGGVVLSEYYSLQPALHVCSFRCVLKCPAGHCHVNKRPNHNVKIVRRVKMGAAAAVSASPLSDRLIDTSLQIVRIAASRLVLRRTIGIISKLFRVLKKPAWTPGVRGANVTLLMKT